MARGNERREVFRDEKDRRRFMETLAEAAAQFGVIVHVYCLMGNHYHLVLGTPQPNLARTMAWLQTTYTVRFNRRHRRSGHLFQGRYKAQLVEADAYAQELVRYIHLNPVRSRGKRGVIAAERARELDRYRWSSHRDYAGWRRKPAWLSLEWRRYWGRNGAEAQRGYRQWMATAFDKPLISPWENLRGGLVLGGQRLWEKTQALVAAKPRREESLWIQQHGHEPAREQARKLAEGEEDWRVKVWIRVRLGGERMTAVARALDYRDGSGVAQVIKRLEQTASRNARLRTRLAQLRRKVKTS
jgi:REP element-mobilizing transposase RayT